MAAFVLQQPNRIVVVEAFWPAKPKILTGPLPKKFARSWTIPTHDRFSSYHVCQGIYIFTCLSEIQWVQIYRLPVLIPVSSVYISFLPQGMKKPEF